MKKLLLAPVFALFSVLLMAQVSPQEKQALLDFYLATDGDNWVQSWDVNAPVADWQGVTVTDNKVTGISLLFNKIKGELPSSIENLEHLQVLELAFNEISGTIPASLGNLKNLEVLSFNGNNLSGEIPASLGKLANLKQLHLSSNDFIGTVPTVLASLENLEVFNVFDNSLKGELPTALAENRNLRELMIAENGFTNTDRFSVILMSNSSSLDFNQMSIVPQGNTVIAIETSDDDN